MTDTASYLQFISQDLRRIADALELRNKHEGYTREGTVNRQQNSSLGMIHGLENLIDKHDPTTPKNDEKWTGLEPR